MELIYTKLKWSLYFVALVLLFSVSEGVKDENDNILVRPRRSLQGAPTTGRQSCQCGLQGLPGRDGRDGRDASLIGPPGQQGKEGIRGFKGNRGGWASGGAVYTRWGRDVCPSKSTKLYSGVMGGSHYSHSGGGSNYLCLPLNPIYEKVLPGNQGSSYIYGTEYETSRQSNIFPTNVQDHDAPCAVCYVETRVSHVMIPARNICPSGWTMEYKGYLMSGHYGHKGRAQFICVDGNPSVTVGGIVSKDEALLYFVEGSCGSLPCPPYIQGNELTCVVCTK